MSDLHEELQIIVNKYCGDAKELTLQIAALFEEFIEVINDQDQIEHIRISDICYIDRDSKLAILYTMDRKFIKFMTYEMSLNILKDYSFVVSDNKILVNIDKVAYVDFSLGKAYFHKTHAKGFRTLSATISKRNISKFQKMCEQKGVTISATMDFLY